MLDHHHRNTLVDFADCDLREALQDHGSRLVLVRDVGNDIDGLTDRQRAYVVDGVMPTHFDGGREVPKPFLNEFARRLASLTA